MIFQWFFINQIIYYSLRLLILGFPVILYQTNYLLLPPSLNTFHVCVFHVCQYTFDGKYLQFCISIKYKNFTALKYSYVTRSLMTIFGLVDRKMLDTPKILPKFTWQNMIGSTHTNTNGTPCMHIKHPIKINHVSATSFGKKNWEQNLGYVSLPL